MTAGTVRSDAVWRWLKTRSRPEGYVAAIALPAGITYAVSWLGWPAFVFEHLIVLLVVVIAILWGIRPAILSAGTSVIADNVLLREPIGRPTITGSRDVLDLLLFASVAVIISDLVRRAHTARLVAEEAAERERLARQDRDRLIATVSHDLATPLSILGGTVHFMKMRGQVSDADLARLLGRIETASARATSLVKTLADVQALESQNFGMQLSTHDLRALLHPIVAMMDRFSERHPVVLATPEQPVNALADADRFPRVIENLINNAIKYSPNGGAVEISVAAEGTHAVIRVRDYGIGISPEALPRIFDASYRAREAAACAPGLGLGLSIASQVVARHHGTIEAAPADGLGTTVTVRLPLAPVGPPGQHSSHGAPSISSERKMH